MDAGNVLDQGNGTFNTKYVTQCSLQVGHPVGMQRALPLLSAPAAATGACEGVTAAFVGLCQGTLYSWKGFSVSVCRRYFDSDREEKRKAKLCGKAANKKQRQMCPNGDLVWSHCADGI